jgi:hypothetical protein
MGVGVVKWELKLDWGGEGKISSIPHLESTGFIFKEITHERTTRLNTLLHHFVPFQQQLIFSSGDFAHTHSHAFALVPYQGSTLAGVCANLWGNNALATNLLDEEQVGSGTTCSHSNGG